MWLVGLAWVDMAIWSSLGRCGYLIWLGSIWLVGLAWVDTAIGSGLGLYGLNRSYLGQNGSMVSLGLI